MVKKILIYSTMSLCCAISAFSQKENKDIKRGNELYRQEKFTEAEVEYRNGLDKNSASFGANYNLGNTLYKEGKYEEAIQQYQIAGSGLKDAKQNATIHHNIGNAFLKQQKYGESIKSYKNALRYNPNDEDTRYNLAYAQKMLIQQQNQQNNNGDNKEDNKDQNQQNQQNQNQQNQNQDKQDNQDQKQDNQNQQSQQNDQKQDKQQQNKPQMSRENAEQILKALEEDEKSLQEKIKLQEKKDAKRYNVEKDW